MKLEINCPFICAPITDICNIELLWSKFPVTILYSLSLMLSKGWECLASSFNVQCLFYPTFLLLAPPPPCVWAIVLTIIMLLSWVNVLKFGGYSNSNRKLTDPHFQEKKRDQSQSILAGAYNGRLITLLRQNWVSDNNLMLANKSICEKPCFCFEMKIFYF